MQTKNDQIRAFLAQNEISEETARSSEYDGKHIALVFSDGEHASTKAGYLLHQRTLLCFDSGFEEKRVDDSLFKHKMRGYGFAYLTHDKAEELRAIILS